MNSGHQALGKQAKMVITLALTQKIFVPKHKLFQNKTLGSYGTSLKEPELHIVGMSTVR